MLPDILKRVVYAKYVLQRAAGLQAESNELSLSVSLLFMHDAVELLMLAVLDDLLIPAKKNREFMDFWPLVRDSGRQEPPDKVPMDSLNRLRVGLKNSGNQPNTQAVRDLLPRRICRSSLLFIIAMARSTVGSERAPTFAPRA